MSDCSELIAPLVATGDLFTARRVALSHSLVQAEPAAPSLFGRASAAHPPGTMGAREAECRAAWVSAVDELLERGPLGEALALIGAAHAPHRHKWIHPVQPSVSSEIDSSENDSSEGDNDQMMNDSSEGDPAPMMSAPPSLNLTECFEEAAEGETLSEVERARETLGVVIDAGASQQRRRSTYGRSASDRSTRDHTWERCCSSLLPPAEASTRCQGGAHWAPCCAFGNGSRNFLRIPALREIWINLRIKTTTPNPP